MTTAPTLNSNVRLDASKNRVLLLVSLALAGGGAGLIALGLQRDWGFVALFWSGVLALLGVAWVVGLQKGGGVAIADCPHCGARMEFTHIKSARTEQCGRCGEWSAGTQTMRPLAPDHLAELAVFPLALPSAPRWPTGSSGAPRCPVCAEVSTRSIEVQATSALGDAFAALSPISLQRVHSLRVPACARHDDGIMLDTDEDDQGLVLLFRSFAYFQDFVALNSQASDQRAGDSRASDSQASDSQASDEDPGQQTLAEFLADNPRPLGLLEPVTCPAHGLPVLTALGWVSRMDLLPSHTWLDAAAENPVCLNLGEHLERPAVGGHERKRIVWCPACEAGMP